MSEFHLMLVRGRRWWARAGRPLFPVIAGGDGTDGGGGDGGQGGSGDPPPDTRSLEEQAQAALDKLDKNETPTEAERSALRKANAELKRARDEAGKFRTESKTEREKREAAEKEAQELRAKHEPDEAKRQAEVQQREEQERQRRSEQRENADLKRENRSLKLRGLFDRAAASKEVDADLAWGYLADRLKDVDPGDEAEARKALAKHLDDAAKEKPGLKLAKFAPSGGGEGFQGGNGGNGKPKSLQEAIEARYR